MVVATHDYDVPASLPVHRVVRTTCSPNCTGSCGQLAFVRDGNIVKIQQAADCPDAVYSPRGCMKGLSYHLQVYGPDRITTPLIRTGERGSGEFREATWEEALDHVASELARIGEAYGFDSIHVFGQVPGSGYVQKGANYRASAATSCGRSVVVSNSIRRSPAWTAAPFSAAIFTMTPSASALSAFGDQSTVAHASTWLVPRLPGFQRAHPEIDLRVVATNDTVDLERDNIDIAIRFATLQMPVPSPDKIFDYLQFPVCAPSLARSRSNPLRAVADLARHVLIDFETVLYGRAWYDWEQWSNAMRLKNLRGSGWMRFSHYDQVIEAARKGSGIAIGKWPHLTDDLREGRLVAPLGGRGTVLVGGFYLELAGTAERAAAEAFVAWLRSQVPRDLEVSRPASTRRGSSVPRSSRV